MPTDYRPTVFLPKTDFPMRGGLPQLEPKLVERWQQMRLYDKLRAVSQGREKFVLHDGPPYANGDLHLGHALNKILKDVINRAQQMLGKDAPYVPGWDCHGLPIEWIVEEKYRAKNQSKDSVPIAQFRQECRDFAAHWVEEQRKQFQRLGVIGDWDHPYLTMSFDAEAQIVREIGKFLCNGGLYKGAKPVLWSVVEQTALAEAEVEYHDHRSNTVWVRFPIVTPSHPALAGAAAVIWTTTPWTLPGNRAIAFSADLQYAVIQPKAVVALSSGAKGQPLTMPVNVGERLLVAEPLIEELRNAVGIASYEKIASFKGTALAGTYEEFLGSLGRRENLRRREKWLYRQPGVSVELARTPEEARIAERTANVGGLGPKAIDEWLKAGLQHFVLRIAHPFDTKEIARILKVRDA